ncbi:MAG: hypothetical protein H6604_04325 [Flavobacteriales bacterium]|nr:hypothetical protein [Flavobacteriales bacterium]
MKKSILFILVLCSLNVSYGQTVSKTKEAEKPASTESDKDSFPASHYISQLEESKKYSKNKKKRTEKSYYIAPEKQKSSVTASSKSSSNAKQEEKISAKVDVNIQRDALSKQYSIIKKQVATMLNPGAAQIDPSALSELVAVNSEFKNLFIASRGTEQDITDTEKSVIQKSMDRNKAIQKQLVNLMSSNQKDLNEKIFNEFQSSVTIFDNYFKAKAKTYTATAVNTDSSYEDFKKGEMQLFGDIQRTIFGIKDFIDFEIENKHNRVYIPVHQSEIFENRYLTRNGKLLISTISKILKENENLFLTVVRSEISASHKKEQDQNENLTVLLNQLRIAMRDSNYPDRVLVVQANSLNSLHKKDSEPLKDVYTFIISN